MPEEREKQLKQIPDPERRQIIKKLAVAIAFAAPSAKIILADADSRDGEGS